jgi:HSP20 family protein
MQCVTPFRRNSLVRVPAREFDKLFEGFFGSMPSLYEGTTMAGVHIEDTEQSLIVHFDAPGFEAADFDISVGENTLKIEAAHKPAEELKLPFGHRQFSRAIKLHADVDGNRVEAAYRSGVLSVTLGKAEKAQWKKVAVK